MICYDWNNFRQDCKVLAEMLSKENITDFVMIERGGVYVGQEVLKHLPKVPNVHSVYVSFYQDQKKRETPIVRLNGICFNPRARVVLCDDLVDSGSSINFLKEHDSFKNVESLKVAVLNIKKSSPKVADFVAKEIEDVWIEYPWEVAQSHSQQSG
jgi:hypoxanthine phosphoribosyltransferase